MFRCRCITAIAFSGFAAPEKAVEMIILKPAAKTPEWLQFNTQLEGVSEADKVPLHEVVRSSIGNDIGSLGEYPDMGSESVFKPATNAAKDAIGSDSVT